MNENHIATADDFRKALVADSARRTERLVLPKSGLPVLARRLSPLRVLMQSDRLAGIDLEHATPEERLTWARKMVATIQEILVKPRLSLDPGPEEIDPNWLPQEDAEFVFRWGLGLELGDTRQLARATASAATSDCAGTDFFRADERADTPEARATVGNVPLPPERGALPDGRSGHAG